MLQKPEQAGPGAYVPLIHAVAVPPAPTFRGVDLACSADGFRRRLLQPFRELIRSM
jgi:hypothetical protein